MSGEANDIPCEKCHADIAAEMASHIGPHSGETSMAGPLGSHVDGESFECWYCHSWYYTGYELAEASGDTATPGVDAHAATTVSCIACHKGDILLPGEYGEGWGIAHFGGPAYHPGSNGYCEVDGTCVDSGCHDDPDDEVEWPPHGIDGVEDIDCIRCHCALRDPTKEGDPDYYHPYHVAPAGGFNLTYFDWDTGILEAHNAFIAESRNDMSMRDENEACIACHTALPVKINWTHARSLEFEAFPGLPVTTDYGPHNWTVSEWSYNGTAISIVWGNTTGDGSTTFGEIEWPGNVDDIYE